MIKQILVKLPLVYKLRILQLRVKRTSSNFFVNFAKERSVYQLPHVIKRHQSLLRRKLGASDPKLQENKITNLRIALQSMNGIVIKPGETFSFWHLIGKPTARKGYIEGLLLSQGEVKTGIGGGLCQLANLLFWLALHTPLEIKERHHHSFDPFPDEHRVLPFGSGASVFFNYIDLRFYNPTHHPFQFQVWLTDQHLKGIVFCESELPYSYHLEERNHQFHHIEGKYFRENEIWRRVIDKRTGKITHRELMIHNYSEVKYDLPH
ncbi:VanW family protein [Brevibacillus centrosporus]|uniref:VanW family protein n=1 Tax=Brevibacillus centrosporus TaxID=54910 RepID=UPI002E1B28B0|nr:VanW family protein [Brevibacillus centrosporus]